MFFSNLIRLGTLKILLNTLSSVLCHSKKSQSNVFTAMSTEFLKILAPINSAEKRIGGSRMELEEKTGHVPHPSSGPLRRSWILSQQKALLNSRWETILVFILHALQVFRNHRPSLLFRTELASRSLLSKWWRLGGVSRSKRANPTRVQAQSRAEGVREWVVGGLPLG